MKRDAEEMIAWIYEKKKVRFDNYAIWKHNVEHFFFLQFSLLMMTHIEISLLLPTSCLSMKRLKQKLEQMPRV